MKTITLDSVTTVHPVTREDKTAMAGLRALVEPNKGQLRGTAARVPFDGIIGHTPQRAGVKYQQDTVGGVPGWWCLVGDALQGQAILHLHGGWFNWGSARAYRNLVGHIAGQAQVNAFIPDYRLAPEHPFPAAVEDIQASYQALVERGIRKIAITGDSAGGNLALVLLSLASTFSVGPSAAVVLSPVTDLTISGNSWETRAAADPYFTREQAAGLVKAYLGGASAIDPKASPLYGNLVGLPPIRVHVGADEVLLDDSRRYVERALANGVDAKLDVWEGMPHGFLGGIGGFAAATKSLEAIGPFLAERLADLKK
ncbi:MAG TPA: alpha/beta hydrolase [Alphaproteobacteria bacterium]|nr:alpha/beta hydrolase [Alphaproteobacteria bacterium]